jgi:hypothetical protein
VHDEKAVPNGPSNLIIDHAMSLGTLHQVTSQCVNESFLVMLGGACMGGDKLRKTTANQRTEF